MIEITKIQGVGDNELRRYILRNPNTLFYAEPRFLALIAEHLDATPFWLFARRGGDYAGLLPYLVKDGPLGPAFNSLAYYGSNGGVIQVEPDSEAKVALIHAFYQEAEKAGAVSATIITNPLAGDAGVYDLQADASFRDERIGLITHFPTLTKADDLVNYFQDPRPRNIRRALKEGATVRKGREKALEFLHSTHVVNITAIGGLPKGGNFFNAIPQYLDKEEWAVFTCTIGDETVAALLLFYFNKTVEYFTPVIVEKYRSTQALALVIYMAMQDAIARGYRNWNWGGTWLTQGGVYDFKKRWGTTEYRYFYYTRVFDRSLKTCTPEFLLDHYPGFFLVPFKHLIQAKGGFNA